MKKAVKAAFPVTVPVLFGYLFLGIAFGVLLQSKGYSFLWAALMSLFVYAGSMQFVAVNLLAGPFSLLNAAVLTLSVNARHLFYGLAMVGPFRGMGKKKPYMIFSLSDETFSLLCAAKAPEGVDDKKFRFCISLLDQSYWVAGSAIGGLVGSAFSFNTTGIDFAMTALFAVIFTEQWQNAKNRVPALTGVAVSAVCLLVFGPQNFIIPSMAGILAVLSLLRAKTERRGEA